MTALQNRIKAEKSITKALISEIVKAGYSVQLWDTEEMHKGLTAKQALDLAMDLDECNIYAYKIINGVKSVKAMFYMVYGNDGFDCICDHSVNDVADQIMTVINPICDKWEDKLA